MPDFISIEVNRNVNSYEDMFAREETYVGNLATRLISFLEVQARAYKTSHILMTAGDDFSYYDAAANFAFIDSLIGTANSKTSEFKIVYSTVTEYLEAVKRESEQKRITFPVY